MVDAYVENQVAMASDEGSAAWTFEIEFWGRCGQGRDEEAASHDLGRLLGAPDEHQVAERVHGDEQAFARDRVPCTEAERRATLSILAEVRPRTVALLSSCTAEELDWDDPERVLPQYANWRTLRQMGWHVADAESRYYLPSLGLGYREPAGDLVEELHLSAKHARRTLETLPADLVVSGPTAVWTTVKLLRRLAWHERAELDVMQALLSKQRTGGHEDAFGAD